MRASISDVLTRRDPSQLAGENFARLHDALRSENPTCRDLVTACVDSFGLTGRAYRAAILQMAELADQSGKQNPYHNPAHTREVTVNWWLLAKEEERHGKALEERYLALGLIAALGHDVGHDGTGNTQETLYVPFRLEAEAADTADQVMARLGVHDGDRAIVRTLILSTDIRSGYPFLEGRQIPVGELTALSDPVALLCARMLRDADLLPSAGTSISAYQARTSELEREANLPPGALGGPAAAAFFDTVVGNHFLSPGAAARLPTLAAIRASAL